jgi:muconolactone delta-isomerase
MAKQQWGYTYRTFDGHRYRIGTWHRTKAEARAKAAKLRKSGHNVRIVKRDGQYVTYARVA